MTAKRKRPARRDTQTVVIDDQTPPEDVRAAVRGLVGHFLDVEFKHHKTYADLDHDYYEEP